MQENNLVTIVVPYYHNKDTLEKAIESILNQSYQNFEIVLVNNNADSQTDQIAKQYQNKDSRIKICYQEKQGVTYAVSLGVRNASGKYLCFLDADDYLDSNFIKILLPYMDKVDLISTSYYKVLENGTKKEMNLEANLYQVKDSFSKIFYNNNSIATFQYIPVFRWGKMYKTSIAKSIIDEYESYGFYMYEDMAFNLLYLEKSTSFRNINYLGVYYIQYEVSMTKINKVNYQDVINLRSKVKNFLHVVYSRNSTPDSSFETCDFDITKYYLSRVIKSSNYSTSKEFFKMMNQDEEYLSSLKKVTSYKASKGYKLYLFFLQKKMFNSIYLAYKYLL